MGKAEALEDLGKAGRLDAKGLEDIAKANKLTAQDLDDFFKAAKDSGKADASVVDSVKATFKPEFSAADIKDLGIVADDTKVAGKDISIVGNDTSSLGKDASALKKDTGTVAKDADKQVQAAVKDTDSYLAQAKKACTSDKKMCAAAVLGSAAALYAANKYLTVKGYQGQITKIENDMDGGVLGYGGTPVAKVTYAKPIDILMTDTIDFSATDCDPNLDGTKSPYKIAGPTEVWIKLDAALTSPGSKGAFKITTGVLSRLGQATGEAAGTVGAAAGQAAGAAAGGLGGAMGGLLKGFTSGLGMWLAIACAVLIFGFIIFKFIM
jgi:hypothetical protein